MPVFDYVLGGCSIPPSLSILPNCALSLWRSTMVLMRGLNKTIPPETWRKTTTILSFLTHLRRCRPSTMMSRPTTTMTCRMLLLVPWPMKLIWTQRRPHLASWRMRLAPPRLQKLPSASQPAGALCWGTPMSRGGSRRRRRQRRGSYWQQRVGRPTSWPFDQGGRQPTGIP